MRKFTVPHAAGAAISRRDFSLALGAFGAAAALAPAKSHAAAALAKAPGTRASGARASGKVDTIVLGAGMAGLRTAALLEAQGQRVIVVEARNRVGGRVFTLFDQPGHPEMGFNTMNDGYGRGLSLAAELGLEMQDVVPRLKGLPPQRLYIGDQSFTREEWARSPLNPFPADLKATMPWEMVNKLLGRNNPLDNWLDWFNPANAALDVALYDYMAAQGLSTAAIRLATFPIPQHGTSAWDVSAVMAMYNEGFIRSTMALGPRSMAVAGGNQRLPQAMAASLKGEVVLGKEVTAIDSDAGGATVTCADGTRFRADRVVSSLPFSVLRRVRISPELSGVQAQAIASMPYQNISYVFLTVERPFWEQDGLPPGMWTDGPLAHVIPQKFGANDHDISGLSVQARGENARHWDRIGPEAAQRLVEATLERIRPAARGAVKATAYHSWSMDPFSGGAFAYYHPGQGTKFPAVMAQPAGRLFFCGEHTSTSTRGVEAALESAERVATELLT